MVKPIATGARARTIMAAWGTRTGRCSTSRSIPRGSRCEPSTTISLSNSSASITLGIHEPEFMPFGMPWTRAESPDLEWDALRFYWRCRAETSPVSWHINFAVIVDGAVVGSTGLMADDFARMRQFETGSWLGRAHQGQGIGKEMRRCFADPRLSGVRRRLGDHWSLARQRAIARCHALTRLHRAGPPADAPGTAGIRIDSSVSK